MSTIKATAMEDDIPIAVAHILEESGPQMSQPDSLNKLTDPFEFDGNDAITRRIAALLEKISDKEQVIGDLQENALSTRHTIVSIVGEAYMTE